MTEEEKKTADALPPLSRFIDLAQEKEPEKTKEEIIAEIKKRSFTVPPADSWDKSS